jgi:hypothetical protein
MSRRSATTPKSGSMSIGAGRVWERSGRLRRAARKPNAYAGRRPGSPLPCSSRARLASNGQPPFNAISPRALRRAQHAGKSRGTLAYLGYSVRGNPAAIKSATSRCERASGSNSSKTLNGAFDPKPTRGTRTSLSASSTATAFLHQLLDGLVELLAGVLQGVLVAGTVD